jgi:acyl-CoA synthetase (AMP-forming)/AMP-acid ligase II
MVPTIAAEPQHAPGPLLGELWRFGDRPSLVQGDRMLTYRELDERVRRAAAALEGPRQVRVVHMADDLDSVVAYLACRHAGHPVLLLPPGGAGQLEGTGHLEATYGGVTDLHPDLALLLSTSGTTGSPRLVRLSTHNLRANTEAIVAYLGLGPEDRGITSLPLHYCYGLSVLHTHLHVGAAVVLEGASVVDPCFREAMARHGVTNLAGVPHTFELLERAGFDRWQIPQLRFVTQAGGRLAPQRVRALAEQGRRNGWELFVMYGQTEATARMAYLPPHLAAECPDAIGIPIPGGALHLDPDGQLVYRGPNVMMGYAEAPEDLALGRCLEELRTGDLAVQRPDGLWQITGRSSRFLKVFGLRIDLDRAEQLLEELGVQGRCTGTDDAGLVVACTGDPSAARTLLAERLGLPLAHVRVLRLDEMPVLPNGKVDYRGILDAAADPAAPTAGDELGGTGHRTPRPGVRELFVERFGRDALHPSATFVSLGGDSLTFVETSLDLEATLGHLPADWHLIPVGELEALEPTAPTRRASMETGVLLRALAISLVLVRHTALLDIAGGAHMLLAVSGYNFSRFGLDAVLRRDRVAPLLAGIARFAVPGALWMVFVIAVSGEAVWANAAFVQVLDAPEHWEPRWRYWYLEAIVQVMAIMALALWIPATRRVVRRHPFAVPMVLALLGLVTRYQLVTIGPELRQLHMAPSILWLFLAGWAAQRAATRSQRLAVSAFAVVCLHGFFGDPLREAFVAATLLALVWVPVVRIPRRLARPIGALAGASLYLYLTHWQVYEPLEDHGVPGVIGLAASVAVGILTWRASEVLMGWWSQLRRSTRSEPTAATSVKSPEARAGT